MALFLWYTVPLLIAGVIGLWQWRVDIAFNRVYPNLTWEQKVAYLRARKVRTWVMVAILAVYLTLVKGAVFERIVGAP